MSQFGLPAVYVQVDLAVQVQHLGLQSLGESPQSDAATLTGRQLRTDTTTQPAVSENHRSIKTTRYQIKDGARSIQ